MYMICVRDPCVQDGGSTCSHLVVAIMACSKPSTLQVQVSCPRRREGDLIVDGGRRVSGPVASFIGTVVAVLSEWVHFSSKTRYGSLVGIYFGSKTRYGSLIGIHFGSKT